jgi:hypothetical protein
MAARQQLGGSAAGSWEAARRRLGGSWAELGGSWAAAGRQLGGSCAVAMRQLAAAAGGGGVQLGSRSWRLPLCGSCHVAFCLWRTAGCYVAAGVAGRSRESGDLQAVAIAEGQGCGEGLLVVCG